MTNKTIYLIRHGQTDWNVERRMQGHVNIPLNALGRSQAESLTPFFQKNPVDKVISSDLDRAVQTAEIATNTKDIVKMACFREVHLGDIEGATEAEILTKYGKEAWLKWISLDPKADYAFPGGETHSQSLKRSLDNILSIFQTMEFRKAALCTHGLLIRRLGHHLRPDYTEMLPIPNCGVFEIEWFQDTIYFHGLVHDPNGSR